MIFQLNGYAIVFSHLLSACFMCIIVINLVVGPGFGIFSIAICIYFVCDIILGISFDYGFAICHNVALLW